VCKHPFFYIKDTTSCHLLLLQVSSLIQRLKADPSYYLGVLVSPAGLCCVAVFLAAIASEVSGSQTQQSGPFIV